MNSASARRNNRGLRTAIIVGVATLCLLAALFAIAFSLLLDPSKMESREYILAHMEQSITENTESGSAYVSSFLDDMGIGNYARRKLRRVENYFRIYYPFDMPEAGELARATAEKFLKDYYGELDPEDKDGITDALIRSYVASTPDRWAAYRTEAENADYNEDMSGNFVGIGVTVEFTEQYSPCPLVRSVIPDSPAEEAGILEGDIITAVDGVSCVELGKDRVTDAIKGEEGTEVKITLLRGEKELTLTAIRRKVEDITVAYSVLEGNIGYVRITRFKANTDEQLRDALIALDEIKVKGIVFDLRSNPGGYLNSVINAMSLLVPNGTRLVSFKYKTAYEDTVYYAEDDYTVTDADGKKTSVDHTVNVPVVVLCNGYTASAGELFTAGVRDFTSMGIIDGCTVGTKTYGKGVMQSEFEVGDGATLAMTVSLYNPPSNVNYEGIGIKPDVHFSDTNGDKVDDTLAQALTELSRLIATPDGSFAV